MEMTFSIDKLKKGMILSKAVRHPRTNNPIAPAGVELSDRAIEIIKSNGVSEVDIELSPEEELFYSNPNAALLMAVDRGIPTTISRESHLKYKNTITPSINGKNYSLNVADVVSAATSMQMEITSPPKSPFLNGNLSYRLNDYRVSNDLMDAAVRIATYATMVANAYNKQGSIPRAKMIIESEIALAALLHNYGAICENDEIRHGINIPDLKKFFPVLTEERIKQLIADYYPPLIPVYSYALARNKSQLLDNSVIKNMIIYSRENRKGTGVLRSQKMVGDSRSTMGAQIISLCALYDEILSKSIREKHDLKMVDDELMDLFYNDVYDRDIIKLFRECIPLYPVGTKVLIYNEYTRDNEYALVIDNTKRKENYRNPIVLTVNDNEEIDLSRTSFSKIIELVSDEVEYSNISMMNANNTSLSGRKK